MSTKHTPGPWDYDRNYQPTGILTFGNSDIIIGELLGDDIPKEELMANAKLIAEAPAMLLSLKKLCLSTGQNWQEAYQEAQRLIKSIEQSP